MDRTPANPLIIAGFFILRCLVPLLIMLGVSYLLRKLGLIKEAPIPPNHRDQPQENANTESGGMLHGSI